MFLIPYNRLTNEQKSIIQRVSRGFDNLFVEGPPGAGKTLISLYAIRDIVNNNTAHPLVLMYNHSLYGYLKSSFNSLGIYDNITLDTKDGFFWNLAKSYSIHNSDNSSDYEEKYRALLKSLLNANLTQKWSVAIIDEIQDFMSDEWEILKKLSGGIISMGDFDQKVYKTDLERSEVSGISRVERLIEIFRFHKNIAKIAKNFSRNRTNIEEKVTKIEQKQPQIIDVNYESEEAEEVANILKTLKNHQKRIGIIAPHRYRLKELKQELSSYGIETVFFDSNKKFREYDFTSNTPLLITAHSAKGLEFENVIVLGFNKSDRGSSFYDPDELIYVSMTRANSGLYIVRNNNTIDKLKKLTTDNESSVEADLDEIFG